MSERTQLGIEFHNEMLRVADEAKKQKYYPTYFLQLVHRVGGVKAAQQLLAKREIQLGLMKLYELGLLHTSVEAYVIQDRFQSLFTETEQAEAKRRLTELNYFVPDRRTGNQG